MTSNTYTLSNFRDIPASSKEEIFKIQFHSNDVLVREEDIRVRRTNLDKAMVLGRDEKFITAIILKSGQQLYRVEDIVESIKDEYIYTKNGLKIPIVCIYSTDFYFKN
ncbi:MAG: hypothetical protein SGJ00_06860 [bacterium]|nr:hypothetical protein [bacterium]